MAAQDGNGDVGGRSEEELQREKIAQQHMVEARDEIYRRNVAHQEVLLRELGQAKQVKASKDALAGKREDELTKNEINYVQTCNEKLTKNRRANYIAFYKVCNEKLDQVEKEEEEYLAELGRTRSFGEKVWRRRKWRLRGRCWGFGEEVNTDEEEEEGVAGERRRRARRKRRRVRRGGPRVAGEKDGGGRESEGEGESRTRRRATRRRPTRRRHSRTLAAVAAAAPPPVMRGGSLDKYT